MKTPKHPTHAQQRGNLRLITTVLIITDPKREMAYLMGRKSVVASLGTLSPEPVAIVDKTCRGLSLTDAGVLN